MNTELLTVVDLAKKCIDETIEHLYRNTYYGERQKAFAAALIYTKATFSPHLLFYPSMLKSVNDYIFHNKDNTDIWLTMATTFISRFAVYEQTHEQLIEVLAKACSHLNIASDFNSQQASSLLPDVYRHQFTEQTEISTKLRCDVWLLVFVTFLVYANIGTLGKNESS